MYGKGFGKGFGENLFLKKVLPDNSSKLFKNKNRTEFGPCGFLAFVFCEERQGSGYNNEDYNKYGNVKRGGRE